MFIKTKDPKIIAQQRRITWAARQLRSNPTTAESILWQHLRNRQLAGYKFRRQFAIYNYIADFYCHACKLVVEVDGDSHDQRQLYDQFRDQMMKEHGYTVLRFPNQEVLQSINVVLNTIESTLLNLKPSTPTRREGWEGGKTLGAR